MNDHQSQYYRRQLTSPSAATKIDRDTRDQEKINPKFNMKFLVLCSIVALAVAQPAKLEVWKSASMDAMVDQSKVECAQKNDEVACMKFKVLNLLDQIFRKDNFKVRSTSSSIGCNDLLRSLSLSFNTAFYFNFPFIRYSRFPKVSK